MQQQRCRWCGELVDGYLCRACGGAQNPQGHGPLPRPELEAAFARGDIPTRLGQLATALRGRVRSYRGGPERFVIGADHAIWPLDGGAARLELRRSGDGVGHTLTVIDSGEEGLREADFADDGALSELGDWLRDRLTAAGRARRDADHSWLERWRERLGAREAGLDRDASAMRLRWLSAAGAEPPLLLELADDALGQLHHEPEVEPATAPPGSARTRRRRTLDLSVPPDTSFPFALAFETRLTAAVGSNLIQVDEVHGSVDEFEVGGMVRVRGRYQLDGEDGAGIFLWLTALSAADDRSAFRSTRDNYKHVTRQSGSFELTTILGYPSWPHVRLQGDGQTLADVYFGAGAFLRP